MTENTVSKNNHPDRCSIFSFYHLQKNMQKNTPRKIPKSSSWNTEYTSSRNLYPKGPEETVSCASSVIQMPYNWLLISPF